MKKEIGGLARLVAAGMLACASFSLYTHLAWGFNLWWEAWFVTVVVGLALAVLSERWNPLFP